MDLELATGVPPRKDMGSVEVLLDGDGVPPRLGVDRQTPVKIVSSRHTTYAGCDKKSYFNPFACVWCLLDP